MEDRKKQDLFDKVISLGKEDALEFAKSIIDNYKVDLKGTEYIDELLEIGMDYDRYGNAERAMEMYKKAEKRALVIGDRYGLGTIYSNIGVLYNNTKDYDQAIKYYQKALELIQEVNNEQELGILYNNLGYVYKNILKYRESVDFYTKALKIFVKVNDKFSMTASYYNLAEVFEKLFTYDTAINYMDKCIEIDRELNLNTLNEDLKYREKLVQKLQKEQGLSPVSANKSDDSENDKEEKGWLWKRKK